MAEQTKSKTPAIKVLVRLFRDMRVLYKWLILAAVLSLISIVLSVVTPEFLGQLTDRIYATVAEGAEFNKSEFVFDVLILAVAYLLSAAFSLITSLVMDYSVTTYFTCGLRIKMSEKIARVPIKVTDSTPNGEIISRMTRDVAYMGGSVYDLFAVLINGALTLTVITVVIFLTNAKMAVAVIIFVPLSMFISSRLAAKSEKSFDECRDSAGKMYSLCEENLTGFDTVKAFGLEKSQNERYGKITSDYSKWAHSGYLAAGKVQPIVAFINNIAYIAICIIGGYLAIEGTVSAGDLVAFIMYTKLFASPLENIAGGMSTMQATVASARRVYEYLDGEEMEEVASDTESEKVLGNVIFDKVYFSYTEDKPLIENLNLNVKAGQKVAIVGPTGGGKTTIVNLLMRFYDPTSGRILVDGKDISEMNRDDARKMFGMVLQDTVLFSGTVYDNIAYGNPFATRDEVVRAAKEAHIDKFIDSLPNGYDTVINEDSTNISGGEKQLLTIARAYLSNRPILILDEATSNIDTRTELIVQETMDTLMEGRTAFVIAHRLSTIEDADVILVVDNGHIVETGTHTELLKNDGLYSRIYKSQYSHLR